MLKVEKKIGKNPVNKNQEDDITKIQNDKKLYKKIYILVIKKKKRKQLKNMRNLLQKLEKNMQNYNKKIIN